MASPYYRPTSPYRTTSPYQSPPHDNYYSRSYSPAPGAAAPIVPGSVTYTTSIGSDGRTLYHPFKAVAASYQTAGGVVSGIQWVPAEATQILPSGAQPATAEFAASWGRGQLGTDDGRVLTGSDWGRDEEKRRKEAKRDADLRNARERDAQANIAREQRKSFTSSPGVGYAFPPAGGYPPNYGGATSYSTGSGGYSSLERQFNDLDLDRRDKDRNRDRDYAGERERKLSRSSKYSASETGGDRPRTISGNLGPRPDAYETSYGPPGPYGNSSMRSYSSGSGPPYPAPNPRASPNLRGGDVPYVPSAGYPGSDYTSPPIPRPPSTNIGRSTTPFGGGAPPGAYPRSRPSSPMPGAPVGPGASAGPYFPGPVAFPQPPTNMPVPGSASGAPAQQLAAPEGFSRPVNGANTFPPFDIIKLQDMDKFWNELPRMPPVLKPHDVFEADWSRLMQDIALAWAGKLPVLEYYPSGQQPKRSGLIKELVELWNTAFFRVRGVELVLYKGRERKTGPQAGVVDKNLPYLEAADDYISSSSETEDTDDSDSDYGVGRYPNVYGQNNPQQPLASVFEAGRLRKEAKLAAKAERRKKRREKHRRRREKYRQRKYSLYLTCLINGATSNQTPLMNPGMPYPAAGPAYGMRGGMAGGYTPGGY